MDNTNWTLEALIGDSLIPVRLTIDKELIIGRAETSQAGFSGLDLTPFHGVEQGVSRRHALLRREGDRLFIVDLNSGNGTFLNHVRLEPERSYHLTDGDQLQIGRLGMTLHLNMAIGQSSIKASRVDLERLRTPAIGQRQRILIVEDDQSITALYEAALQKGGFTVQTCRDVVSAIRIFHQIPPALVLIDLKLPSVPGFELCRYIRRDTQFPDVPIVIASAASDKDTIEQAMEAEVDVYFAKPINMKELVRTITALVYNAEANHPTLVTKRLGGTASLQPVSAASRPDTLILFVEGHHEPLSLTVQTAVILGRQRNDSSTAGVLDLGPYGAFEKGVSRAHARIKRQGNTFLVDDLGSANGTFLNGHSLSQREAQQINSGDELRLGELRMRVYCLEEAESGRGHTIVDH